MKFYYTRFILCIVLALLPGFQVPVQASFFYAAASAGGGGPGTPLVWWKTNEGSGTALTGDGSASDDGTTDADWAVGQSGSGGSLDFNASSDEAQTNASITYGTNILTVMFWMRADTLSATRLLVESSADFNSNNNSWGIFHNGSSQIFATMVGTAGTARMEHIAAISAATWYHIAVVLDGSATNDIKIYVNGTVQSTTVDSANRGSTANFAAYTLNLGARNAASLFYDGKIDDFRVYTGEISSGDISTIHAANSQ